MKHSQFIAKKRGFGLLEVIVASLVLGFLILGLNILQKGNREAILRVRARDAANIVAQHILDSLGSLGINSLPAADGNGFIIADRPYTYYFYGKPQTNKNSDSILVPMDYTVHVALLDETPDDVRSSIDTTCFTAANRGGGGITDSEKNTFAKSLEATISWNFKKSVQSIRVAKVVR